MTALVVAVITGVGSLIAAGLTWWSGRRRRLAAEAAWKQLADQQAARAAGAEKVVEEQGAAALETQADLEQEIHDAATDRLAHPDLGARARVQGRWKRTDAASGDVSAGLPAAVSDGPAGGSGPSAGRHPGVRGKR